MAVSTAPGRYALGIDIGGTFTDIVLHDRDTGESHSLKVLTTHEDPRRGVLSGVGDLLGQAAVSPKSIGRVIHATTLFTNAIIERKGARTALLTTKGFRDTLEIGNERKFDLYDISIEKPLPLVPRELRFELDERIDATGRIVRPFDATSLSETISRLRDERIESLAIVLLHSYLDPSHERRAAEAIAAAMPDLPTTISYDVAPEMREYERTSTTVASAYVKPLASRYLTGLQADLKAIGISAPLLLMLSNGGLTHTAEVIRNPVQMLESGPAAGALSAAFFGGRDDITELLGFDMGGTTAKLSLVESGEPLIAYAFEAGRQKRFMEGSGLPIRISTIELIEIGAGGGSIARADSLGLLKVGPDSAGSEPGPVCYGRGGTEPTVTDVNLLLGYLNADFFAGGTMAIDAKAAAASLAELSSKLGLTWQTTASGIHSLVSETMASAARVHIAEHGRDPRQYTLLVTGGGGPVHGYSVARSLGVSRLICPPSPGVASAWGLLVAPARIDRVRSVSFRVQEDNLAELEKAFKDLEDSARRVVMSSGLDADELHTVRYADGRYIGQGFSLVVPLPAGPYDDAAQARDALVAAFQAEYQRKFARAPQDVKLEFIAVRVSVRTGGRRSAVAAPPKGVGAAAAVKGARSAWFAETSGFVETVVYDRLKLGIGDSFAGPALVEDAGSTFVAGPRAKCRVTSSGSIVADLT